MSDPAPQQPSPVKRGRGRGRGSSARGAASARAGRKVTAGRRGRQKIYETSRAQAAHERQRDLKNAYATVAAAMKPALEELADRNIDLLKSKFDAHQEVEQYAEITRFLDQRLQGRLSELDAKLKLSTATAHHEWNAKQIYTGESFHVSPQSINQSRSFTFIPSLLFPNPRRTCSHPARTAGMTSLRITSTPSSDASTY